MQRLKEPSNAFSWEKVPPTAILASPTLSIKVNIIHILLKKKLL
jgi:hypothetical protein